MKKMFMFLFILVVLLVFSFQANAELFNRGTDINGNRLIYDSDFNITWYDYTNTNVGGTWQNQNNWASGLTVTFEGIIFNDWRLPATVDGPWVFGYDGTTTAGYNITNSEMGHLFYTELGNKGRYDTSGNPQWGYGLTNKGPFNNLQEAFYWSDEYTSNTIYGPWGFYFMKGAQGTEGKGDAYQYYAIAVRPGDVIVVPEPISSTLFIIGAGVLAGRRYFRRGK
jgi:hypothetical protein